jgi:G6PDH family F420-dependent oxidoreductase
VLGGIAGATQRLQVGTGVTCPLIRIHPAIIAQAAATTAAMMPGRFFLGLGTGENLNEHVVGEGWPNITVRREMLDEAIKVIRGLWTGELFEHRGPYYTVEDARIYTLPDEPPPIYIAASGEESAKFAGEVGDGYIATAPKREFVQAFERGGGGKPKYGQITVCYAADEASARKTAHEVWPNAAIPGELSVELPLPRHYEQASKNVTEDDVGVRAGGIRPRLHPPGRPRPRGLLPLLPRAHPPRAHPQPPHASGIASARPASRRMSVGDGPPPAVPFRASRRYDCVTLPRRSRSWSPNASHNSRSRR